MGKWFVPLVALIAWGNLAHAEGGCPPGQYPYDTPQARQCVPIATDAGGSGYWADRYAAIVWGHNADGSPAYSWAAGASSQERADAAAMADCKHSGYADCRVALEFANGYFAVVRSQQGHLYAGSEFGRWGARRQAMSHCKRNGGVQCKVVESQRSRSEWIE